MLFQLIHVNEFRYSHVSPGFRGRGTPLSDIEKPKWKPLRESLREGIQAGTFKIRQIIIACKTHFNVSVNVYALLGTACVNGGFAEPKIQYPTRETFMALEKCVKTPEYLSKANLPKTKRTRLSDSSERERWDNLRAGLRMRIQAGEFTISDVGYVLSEHFKVKVAPQSILGTPTAGGFSEPRTVYPMLETLVALEEFVKAPAKYLSPPVETQEPFEPVETQPRLANPETLQGLCTIATGLPTECSVAAFKKYIEQNPCASPRLLPSKEQMAKHYGTTSTFVESVMQNLHPLVVMRRGVRRNEMGKIDLTGASYVISTPEGRVYLTHERTSYKQEKAFLFSFLSTIMANRLIPEIRDGIFSLSSQFPHLINPKDFIFSDALLQNMKTKKLMASSLHKRDFNVFLHPGPDWPLAWTRIADLINLMDIRGLDDNDLCTVEGMKKILEVWKKRKIRIPRALNVQVAPAVAAYIRAKQDQTINVNEMALALAIPESLAEKFIREALKSPSDVTWL